MMDIRDTLNRHRGISVAIGVLAIAGAIAAIFIQQSDGAIGGSSAKLYLTTDDGKSWIVDKTQDPPPVQVEGKTAYRAYLFTPDGGKTRFAGYLERYTPAGKKRFEEMKQKRKQARGRPDLTPGLSAEIEIKRPGEPAWVKQSDVQRAAKIMDVRCPNDPSRPAEMVLN
jgi:hypothetical protein